VGRGNELPDRARFADDWRQLSSGGHQHLHFIIVDDPLNPGQAVSEADGTTLAPHLTVLCFARGLLKPVLTRLYFSDEQEANESDPVLQAIGDATERATLVATAIGSASYRFDIRLQGDEQTVFFTTPAAGL